MPLRVHVLQHSESTPPGSVLEWLQAKGHAATVVRLWNGDALPRLSDTDWLIVCGGPMNVDDTAEHPFLVPEKQLLKDAIAAKKPCLGLCLGGQLLAQALGARVSKNEHWEVGWHGISLGSGTGSERLMVFQWHQDMFTLPEGATRVATNKITENQAFAFGTNILGLQFHPEATEEWVKECAEDSDYPVGPHVQPKEQVLEGLVFIHPMKKWFFSLLDRMEQMALKSSAR